MRLKNILDVTECPNCKKKESYYTKSYMFGWVMDITSFDTDLLGNREKENHQMFDSLRQRKRNRTCYCSICDTPIGIDKSE